MKHLNFALEGYVLAMIWGALKEQSDSDAPKHRDFYKLKRGFLYQLRVEHPVLELKLKTDALFHIFHGMISASSSAARARSEPIPEPESAAEGLSRAQC